MKKYSILYLSLLILVDLFAGEIHTKRNKLWYDQPAKEWTEALPLGNGRLGAMVFGSIVKERLQLNEESLWAGEPVDTYPSFSLS